MTAYTMSCSRWDCIDCGACRPRLRLVRPTVETENTAVSPPDRLTEGEVGGRVDQHSDGPADSATEPSCQATKGPWT